MATGTHADFRTQHARPARMSVVPTHEQGIGGGVKRKHALRHLQTQGVEPLCLPAHGG